MTILVGLGSNLPGIAGQPRQALLAARARLDEAPLRVAAFSRIWRTRPLPDTGQPWFANAVAAVETGLEPGDLLRHLHGIEREFGRERRKVNAARTLDLDLLDYHGETMTDPALPHPRLAERAFVLLPLAEVAPDWRHPLSNLSIPEMLAGLQGPQDAVAEEDRP